MAALELHNTFKDDLEFFNGIAQYTRDGHVYRSILQGERNLKVYKKAIEKYGIPNSDTDYIGYKLVRFAIAMDIPTDIVELLIDNGCSIGVTLNGHSPLHVAVEKINFQAVDLLLRKGAILKSVDINGDTPLHYAAKAHDSAVLRLLLEAIDKECSSELEKPFSELHMACLKNDIGKVQSLLRSGADVNEPVRPDSDWWPDHTALHLATIMGYAEIVELLLMKHGADYYAKTTRNRTALHIATINSYDHGSTTGYMDKLKDAAEISRYKRVRSLLLRLHPTKDSLINQEDYNGFSHFHCACLASFGFNLANAFLQKGVDVNGAVDENCRFWPGYRCLHFAVMGQNRALIESLLAKGADSTAFNSDRSNKQTPVHMALNLKNCKHINQILDLLLASQERAERYVNPADKYGVSHLHIACKRDRNELVRALCRGSDLVNEMTSDEYEQWPSYTPLHVAVLHLSRKVVAVLLECGASVEVIEHKMQWTPLHFAAFQLDWELAQKLVTAKADTNALDFKNKTPLMVALEPSLPYVKPYIANYDDICACRDKRVDWLKWLKCVDVMTNNVSDVNVINWDGITLLHLLAQKTFNETVPTHDEMRKLYASYYSIVKKMINVGCDINAKGKRQRTPLHVMFLNRNYIGACALYNLGASIEIKDMRERTPMDFCNSIVFHSYLEKTDPKHRTLPDSYRQSSGRRLPCYIV